MLFLPGMLHGFFTSQVYTLLEDSQKQVQFVHIESTINEPDKIVIADTGTEKAGVASSPKTEPTPSDQFNNVQVTATESGVGQKQRPSQELEMKSGTILIQAVESNQISTSLSSSVYSQPAMLMTVSPVGPGTDPSGLPPVGHLFLPDEPSPELPSFLPEAFANIIKQQASSQTEETKRYNHTEGNNTLLYVIHSQFLDGKPTHLVSYAWGSYIQELSASLMNKLFIIMIALCLISWIPSLLLARFLVKPLAQIEEAASRISEHNWNQPLVVQRRDEIGRLANAFEQMRQRLVRQDEAQQAFLQNLSHELKTPAMVISSYARAIQDGIFPRGNLHDSVAVIQSESERMQKRVQNFLYLNKLKYLAVHEAERDTIRLDLLLQETMERLRWHRPEVEWILHLQQAEIIGNRQQWSVAMENLLDNQMRYAKSRVEITMNHNEELSGGFELRVFNDGPAIKQDLLEMIFDPYASGKDGQFGLGLAITRQVTNMHGAKLWASNEEQGVAFYIEM
ncbi:MAG TPA: HAMP domain-containing sensor histidine kinase [Syntrophomonadaceae bacterium]|nr:HAMP domain-containing sensor histidine kinase [Syntrophomonadaceae bacterium]